jgi:beta-lactamase regulating signal transducer with metallopeptidase domain
MGILVKVTIVLLLALGTAALLRRRSADLRYLVLAASLVGVLFIPVMAALLPPVHTSLIPAARPVAPEPFPHAAVQGVAPAGGAEARPAPGPTPAVQSAAPRARPIGPALALIWMFGAVAILAALTNGALGMRALVRRAHRPDDGDWQSLADLLSAKLRMGSSARVLMSAEVSAPLAWGMRRPVILLPVEAGSWPHDRRRAVLLHELVHVARRDSAMECLALLASALYWFHPGVWMAARRMRLERELACDDAVVRRHMAAAEYATHLVDIAAATSALRRTRTSLAMGAGGALEHRIRALLAPKPRRMPLRAAGRVAFGSAALVLMAGLAAMRPATPPRAPGMADTLELAIAPERPISWTGALQPGDTLSVRAAMGDITVDSSGTGAVELEAVRKVGPRGVGADTRIAIIRSARALAVCSVHFDGGRRVAPCLPGEEWGRGSVDDNAVSFRVTVPSGVHVVLLTGLGDLDARRLHADVKAVTGAGFASIQTDGAADVQALSGGMRVAVLPGGRAGPIVLHGMHSGIDLILPTGVGADVSARTGRGMITLPGGTSGDGTSESEFRGRVAGGGRSVRASLEKGDIRISTP